MTVIAIPQGNGVARAKIVCDDCSREEVVACDYDRPNKSQPAKPNEAQARRKVTSHGWTYIKGTLRCPKCEAKRKAMAEKPEPQDNGAAEQPPREPTRKQRREIIDMLAECYDTEAERYDGGDTDETVASVLGVMPGWVAQLREEFFGPDGGNDDIEELAQELAEFQKKLGQMLKDQTAALGEIRKAISENEAHAEQLQRIKKAVGPRKLTVAGIR